MEVIAEHFSNLVAQRQGLKEGQLLRTRAGQRRKEKVGKRGCWLPGAWGLRGTNKGGVHSPAERVSLGWARSCVSGGVQGDTKASQEGRFPSRFPGKQMRNGVRSDEIQWGDTCEREGRGAGAGREG